MILLAEFIFENIEALGPNEFILSRGEKDLYVHIFRTLRCNPLPEMKQPSLNGAIMGIESSIKISVNGNPAYDYKWTLYANNKRMQIGRTNRNGISTGLKIDLPYGKLTTYKISISKTSRKSLKKALV